MEFMQRLVALVPWPRLHLIRFHGVLAPNARLRSRVVPVPEQTTMEWICFRRLKLSIRTGICRGGRVRSAQAHEIA